MTDINFFEKPLKDKLTNNNKEEYVQNIKPWSPIIKSAMNIMAIDRLAANSLLVNMKGKKINPASKGVKLGGCGTIRLRTTSAPKNMIPLINSLFNIDISV